MLRATSGRTFFVHLRCNQRCNQRHNQRCNQILSCGLFSLSARKHSVSLTLDCPTNMSSSSTLTHQIRFASQFLSGFWLIFASAILQIYSTPAFLQAQDSTSATSVPQPFAQETLVGSILPDVQYTGFYAAPLLRVMPINDRLGIAVGGYGGWHFNHVLMIGVGGSAIVGGSIAPQFPISASTPSYIDSYSHFGGIIEYTVGSEQLLHWGGSMFVGAGRSSVRIRRSLGGSAPNQFITTSYPSSFAVIEPAVFVEFNLLQSTRASFGAAYRFMLPPGSVNFPGNESDRQAFDDVLRLSSGLSLTLAVKFGKF
jgi:hypothetical protein